MKDIQKLAELVIPYDLELDRPAIPDYFHSLPGKAILSEVQVKNNGAIQFGQNAEAKSLHPKQGGFTVSYRVQVSKDRYVLLVMGDITKYAVNTIVNAANENLDNCGGVALAISEAGRPMHV